MKERRLREYLFSIIEKTLSPIGLLILAGAGVFGLVFYLIFRIGGTLPPDQEHIDHFLAHKSQIVALAHEIRSFDFDGGIWLDLVSTGHPLSREPQRLEDLRKRMIELKIWSASANPVQDCVRLTYLVNLERDSHGKDFTDCPPAGEDWEIIYDFTDPLTGQEGRYWRRNYDNGEYVEMRTISEGWYLHYYFHAVP